MIWWLIVFEVPLVVCRMFWDRANVLYNYTIPGSLERTAAAHVRRVWRWPGGLAYLYMTVLNTVLDAPNMHSWWGLVFLPMDLVFAAVALLDLHQLRKELREDDNDWWNKTKRGTRKALRSAVRALKPRVPVSVPS